MSDVELKSISKTMYNFVLDAMEIESLAHPETYETAARVGERLRGKLTDLGQIDNLEPIPHLPPKK